MNNAIDNNPLRAAVVLGLAGLAAGVAVFAYGVDVALPDLDADAKALASPAPAVRAARKAISREKLRELSPKVAVTPEGGRLLLGVLPDEDGVVHAEIPELEDVLALEDADEAHRDQLLADTRAVIPESVQLRSLDVACGQSLCRIKLIKAQGSEADWSAIDTAIAPLVQGEKIFLTEADPQSEVGYVYFSGDHGVLPLAQVALPEEDEGT